MRQAVSWRSTIFQNTRVEGIKRNASSQSAVIESRATDAGSWPCPATMAPKYILTCSGFIFRVTLTLRLATAAIFLDGDNITIDRANLFTERSARAQ